MKISRPYPRKRRRSPGIYPGQGKAAEGAAVTRSNIPGLREGASDRIEQNFRTTSRGSSGFPRKGLESPFAPTLSENVKTVMFLS